MSNRRFNLCTAGRPRAVSAIVTAVLLAVLSATAARAGTDATWVGPYGGNWSVAENWDPAVVPNGAGYDVLIDTDSGVASSVLLNGTYTVGTLTIDAGDQLTISNNHNLYPTGNVFNNGLLAIEATLSATYLRIAGVAVTFDGSGALVMSDSSRNRISANDWTYRLTNTGSHTIRGAGDVGGNNMVLTNNSLIQADQLTPLVINLAGNAEHQNYNTGTMQAISGGTLSLSGSPIDNTAGVIQALDGSAVTLSGNSHIYNGTLATQGTGQIRVTGDSWIESLSNTGDLSVENNANCYVRGMIDNPGTVSVNATTSNTYLRLDQAEAGFTGTGEIVLGDSGRNMIHANDWTYRFTNTGGHTIRGGGNIGGNNMLLTNAATIQADCAGVTMSVDTGGSSYESCNTGIMKATGGGILSISGSTLDNTGGTIEAQNESYVDLTQGTHVRNGTLSTEGTGLIRVSANSNAYLDSVTNTGRVSVLNNADLYVRGAITNDGTIGVDSPGSNATDIRLDQSAATLTGDGEVVLADHANNRISADDWRYRLTNAGNHTIRGGGSLGLNNMLLTNESLIQADGSDVTMTVDLPGNAENENFNTGVMQAAAGAVLSLYATPINNDSGEIRALDGSFVSLSGGTHIYNGELDTEGSGLIRASGGNAACIEGVTSNGHISLLNGSDLYIRGTLTNNGTIGVDSSGSNATNLLLDQAEATLTGDGEVVLASRANNRIYANDWTYRLINTGNHAIRGGGSFGLNNMLLTNESLIEADQAGVTMSLDVANGGESLNTGVVQATGGGVLALSGSPINNDTGEIKALDGSFVDLSGGTHIYNGELDTEGSGLIRVPNGQTAYIENLTSSGHISVLNNANFYLRGVVTNNGTIGVDSSGSNATNLLLDQAEATLTGDGEVVLASRANNRIYASDWTYRLINTGNHAIRGGGSFGLNSMLLTNESLIEADQPGVTMAIDMANGGESFNGGVMQATGGGTLYLYASPIDNESGEIKALDESYVDLGGGTHVYNGELHTEGSGLIRVPGGHSAYIENLTSDGHISVCNNADLYVRGIVTNNGTIGVDSPGVNTTHLRLDQAEATLAGDGEVVLADHSYNRIYANDWSYVLTNGVNHTIRGGGSIGANNMGLINQGSIVADASGGMTLDLSNAGFDNQGTLHVTNESTMYIAPTPFTTSGTVTVDETCVLTRSGDYPQTAGLTTVHGELSVSAGIDLQGGVLGGNGLVSAYVGNTGGAVGPGASAGTLTIDDDYDQASEAELRIELGGTDDGEFDVLEVTGTAALAGTLSLTVIDDYVPMPGDSFVILTAALVDSEFETVTVAGLPDGLCEDVGYSDTEVTVTIIGTVITQQPTDQTVCLDDPVEFTVEYTGTDPDGYQWRKDGVDIPGEEDATLSIESVTTEDAGMYDVVITNICGTMTSEPATLVVNTPPVIEVEPVGATLCEGGPFEISVTASGTTPFDYRWRKDGVEIPGEESDTFRIDAVTTADAGAYDVVVTNVCGTAISADAVLVVNTAPVIIVDPVGATLCEGEPLEISVTASGTTPYDYRWRKDGVEIPGEESDTFGIDAVTTTDAGAYDVVVTNVCGTIISADAVLVVNTAPTIITDPAGATLCEGAPFEISVTASGTTPYDYRWRKDGVEIPGERSGTFRIDAVTSADAGVYDVVVTNVCGTVTSADAILVVNTAPTIISEPVGATLCEGAPFEVSVTASGTTPLDYRWRRDGVEIPGEESDTLRIDAVTTADAGVYDVVVTNVCGTVTSADAVLVVNTAPAIITEPVGAILCEGDPFVLSVTVSGTTPYDYRWRKDGVGIPGEESDTFRIDAVTTADAGAYDVVVTNVCGTVTSVDAVLVVDVAPTIVLHPVGVSVCEGTPVTFTVEAVGTLPFDYIWRKDGVVLPWAQTDTLEIESADASDAGEYDVIVENACGSAPSHVATLEVELSGPADLDTDCDVDLDDFAEFSACMIGPDLPVPSGCEEADITGDGQVDLLDFAEFAALYTGAQ